MQKLSKLNYKFNIIVSFFFTLIYSFFIGLIPYLDGNIDFVKSYDFFSGGFDTLLTNWRSIHPPLKEFILFLIYKLFGVNSFSYSIVGLILGIIGINYFYFLAKKISNSKVAKMCTLLFAFSPLFLATSIFSLTDYLLTIFILISLYHYLNNNLFISTAFSSFAVLTKESGLLFGISIIITEVFLLFKNAIRRKVVPLKNLLFIFFPILIFSLWVLFLKSYSKPLWSDWNFSGKENLFSTLSNNIFSLNLLNKYAYQNWLHLFVLNFNWIFWVVIIFGLITLLTKEFIPQDFNDIQRKMMKITIVFTFLYFFLILSYQTYTIPRYILPLLPFLYLSSTFLSWKLFHKYRYFYKLIFIFLFIFIPTALFTSSDPLSKYFWGTEKILGEEIYGLRNHLSGNDGITYNLQYLLITKKRNNLIKMASLEGGSVQSDECFFIFADPRNDIKTIGILRLNINPDKPCENGVY